MGRYLWKLQQKSLKIYRKNILGGKEPKLIWILKIFGFFEQLLTVRGGGN